MGDAVAVAACREFFHHIVRMRDAMAVLALGNHLVLRLMTVDTGNILMLGGAGHEEAVSGVMAGGAQLGGCIIRINNLQGHMGLMAGQAVALHHILGMGGMAVGAVRDLAMRRMTCGTELFGVFARVLFQLLNLLRMTGKAGVGQIVGQGDVQRGMRVLVAVQAAFQLKVLFARVAHAALGNNVGVCGGVTLVAFDAGYFGFVFASGAFNRFWGRFVALGTIVYA